MSAFGPKRTSPVAAHMSAFGGKADMAVCGSPLSRSLFGETCRFALPMSVYDPKRTSTAPHGLPEKLARAHREQIRLTSLGLFKTTQIWALQ